MRRALSRHNGFLVFREEEFDRYVWEYKESCLHEIENASDDYLLNVNEEEFTTYLVEKYSLSPLILRTDEKEVSQYEREIPAEYFSQEFIVRPGHKYKKPVIVYHIPVDGDLRLLRCVPPHQRILWTHEMYINDG